MRPLCQPNYLSHYVSCSMQMRGNGLQQKRLEAMCKGEARGNSHASLTHLEVEEGTEEKAEDVHCREHLSEEVIHPGGAEELQLPPEEEQS